MWWRSARRNIWGPVVFLCALGAGSFDVCADSAGGERVLVLIDPQDDDSIAIGNHYIAVRKIPAINVIYVPLVAANYQEFASRQIPAILGTLKERGTDAQIDFMVVASSQVYRYAAAGLVSETSPSCPAPINHISLTSALATARFAGQILSGSDVSSFGLTSSVLNGYYAKDGSSIAFDGAVRWSDGNPTQGSEGRRFFVATMLGYTGPGGNSVSEIKAMIDRSDAVDGTHPPGTFYYMVTDDIARTAPREPFFDVATNAIKQAGGDAMRLDGLVPPMGVDVLGIMTGTNSWSLQPGDITLAAGAFCDHLTSFAADFGNPSQTKISDWIRIGASGSHGTVEEPCALAGKFPHPRIHSHYFNGLTLGESVYRSLEYIPLQTLVYGDPLTRPFVTLPLVTVAEPLEDPATGVVGVEPFFPAGDEQNMDRVELYVDGVKLAGSAPGFPIFFDSTAISDGTHELRLIAVNDSNAAARGDWKGILEVANLNRSVDGGVEPSDGDVSTSFLFKGIASSGGDVREIRIKVNDRIMAVVQGAIGAASIVGQLMGEGSVKCIAEALYSDGSTAVSRMYSASVDATTGACCLANGICRQHSEASCEALGGWFSTNGVACKSVSCPTCGTGDYDGNGAIDLTDLDGFSSCFSGALTPPDAMTSGIAAQCLCAFDFDEDNDVDAADTLVLTPRITGPRAADQGLQAYDYVARINSLDPRIISLAATDSDGAPLDFNLTQPPSGVTAALSGSQVFLTPLTMAMANSVSTLGFSVANSVGVSTNGQVLLEFGPEYGSVVELSVDGVGESSARVAFSVPDVNGVAERSYPFETQFAATTGMIQIAAEDPHGVSSFERWVINGTAMPLGMNPVTIALDRNITAVAAYTPKRRLTIKSSYAGSTILVLGVVAAPAPFTLNLLVSASATVLPQFNTGFSHWRLDGIDQPCPPQPPCYVITVNDLSRDRVLVAVFNNVPGDFDADGDVDLLDSGEFGRCFSGDAGSGGFVPPSPDCVAAFDLQGGDGDVDGADWHEISSRLTGPF